MGPVQPGRVVAVNVAVVRDDPFTRVKSGRSGIDKRPADGPVWLDVEGVAGDTICDTDNHGGPGQAVYAYSVDDLDFWTEQLRRPVEPGNVGENLTLSGVDCSHAVVGERWQVGDAVLRVKGPRTPTSSMSGAFHRPGPAAGHSEASTSRIPVTVDQASVMSSVVRHRSATSPQS